MGPDHPLVAAARTALGVRRAAAAPAPVAPAPAVVQAPVAAPRPVAQPPVVQAPEVHAPVMAAQHAQPPVAPPPLHAEPERVAPQALPPAPPVEKPPVSPPPSFTVSPSPARTTRSTSLPWIEVTEAPTFDRMRPPSAPRNSGSNGTIASPVRNGNGGSHGNGAGVAAPHTMESPLAFHPLTEAPPAPRTPTPAAASAPAPVDAHAQSPFTNSFARLVAETPLGRNAIAYDAPPPATHHIEEPRSEISLDWPLEPRRPWLKIIGALAALALIAGGGWYVLSRYEATEATSKVATSVAKKAAPLVAAKTDTLLVKHDSVPSGPPASVVKPGVTSEIVPTQKPVAAPAPAPAAPSSVSADQGPPPEAKHATHVAAKPAAAEADPDLIAAPAMPSIKVDAITNMIDDSARHRADSVGSAIQQKAPIFKPKAYKPPS
jgi:hypothetical protein